MKLTDLLKALTIKKKKNNHSEIFSIKSYTSPKNLFIEPVPTTL